MATLLSVRDLRVVYPLADEPALDGVSFQLRPGERLLVVGASGSGKSTLLLAVAGLIPRAVEASLSGTVEIEGQSVSEMAPGRAAQRVGVVFQDPESQFCTLTVEDEVVFGLENARVPRAEMDRRIDEALRAVGLEDVRRNRLDRLSGGQKQKLALACALALKPPLLALDEPTANLDPRATRAFFELLARLDRERGPAVLLVEHKLEHAASLVDRVLVLDRGRVVADEGARSFFARPRDQLQRLGVWQPFASELAHHVATIRPLAPHPLTTAELLRQAADPPVAKAVAAAVRATRRAQPARRETPAGAAPALAFRGVTFSYATPAGPVPVLRGVDWEVRRGDFVALVGPNGAGKTTLAQVALGLLRPDGGAVELFGEPVARLPRRRVARLAGLVFQNPEHQFVTDTVAEEIAYSLRVAGGEGDVDEQRVKALLQEFALEHVASAHPFTLSQGEKRRLSVAAMVAAGQELLILDEPTFGQDAANAQRIMDHLRARWQAGCTIVMITHDMRLVWEHAATVAVLLDGRVAFAGPPDELFFCQPELLERAGLEPPPAVSLLAALAHASPAQEAI